MPLLALLLLASACDPAPALEGKQLFDRGLFAQAEVLFRRALNCPSPRLADRINLAATLRERHALDEARRVLAAEPANEPAEMQIAYWNCLALIEEQSARPAHAEIAYRRALALVDDSTPARLALQLWTNFARQHMNQSRLHEAEAAMNSARELPGWNHDRPFAFDLNLAELRRMQGRPREAEAILRNLHKQAPSLPAHLRGAVANNIASLYAARHAHRDAEALWLAANEAFSEAYGAHHPVLAKSLNNLAAFYFSRSRFADAESLFRQALDIREEPLILNNLGTLLQHRGRIAEAEALYRRALSLLPVSTRAAIQPLGNLALLLTQKGEFDDALRHFQRVVQLLPFATPADEPVAARFLDQYERLLRQRREAAEAERVAAMAMRYRVRTALRAGN